MLITNSIGHISSGAFNAKPIDLLEIEWFEASKRILRRKTQSGKEYAIKMFGEGKKLNDGDVLAETDEAFVVVRIKPCTVILLKPRTLMEMGLVCYEIGNKHVPLFLQDTNEVLLPFEEPLFRWLVASGFEPLKTERVLNNRLRSSVDAHSHDSGGSSLFSKIIQMASS